MQTPEPRSFPVLRTLLASCMGVGLFIAPISSQAGTPPSADFCAAVKGAKDWPLKKIENTDNRVSFLNSGEKRNGVVGACWWHSRLQRNAIYLADFAPNEPKPTDKESIRILRKILRGRGIVKVPGYANLSEFTEKNADLLKEELIHFRNRSFLLRFEWARKVFRPLSLTDKRMEKEMAETEATLANGDIPYWMLQVGDIGAHSWLITDMTMRPDTATRVSTVDSNYRKTKSWAHSERKERTEADGTKVELKDGENFFGIFYVPFNDRRVELRRIRRIAERKCGAVSVSDAQNAPNVEEVTVTPGLEDAVLDSIEQE